MNVVDIDFGTVLLIGGCGFLGYNTVIDLIEKTKAAKASNVHIFDLKTIKDHPFYSPQIPKENYHQGDICDPVRLECVLEQVKPVVIFDLVSPPMFELKLRDYMRVNVHARSQLLDFAKSVGTKAFVYNSSAGVVHDSHSDLVNADESLPVLYMPQQREPYSHSKAVAETLVLNANGNARKGEMLTASIRLCSPFGAHHAETTKAIVENARQGKLRFQIGDGSNLSDWAYVSNGVRSYLLAAQALLKSHGRKTQTPEGDRVDGEAFFVTNGEPIRFWEFARGLGTAAGFPTPVEEIRVIPRSVGMFMAFVSEWVTWICSFGRRRAAFTRHGVRYGTITRYHCIEKARQRLKYDPVVSLEEGMWRATASYRKKSTE
ncbi:MAG: hypothetical protein Q9159_003769 [Coniocarpon cinnabarinum]